MEKIGVADYGMKVWYGNFYDYEERLRNVRAIGYDGLERLHPMSAEDALMKAARLKELGMGFATCNAPYMEWSIKWTSALGGKYVWAEVSGKDFETYLRQVSEQTRVAKKRFFRPCLFKRPVSTDIFTSLSDFKTLVRDNVY